MKNFSNFLQEIKTQFSDNQILSDTLSKAIYARDASLYRIEPKLILVVENEDQMQFVLKLAYQYEIPLGFRAAGTSLSGQALCSGVLLIQGQGWRGLKVLENGDKIKCQPGIRGSEANAHLAPYQRKIGPDPASIDAAKIGGIAANNASGMCCGTKQNSYQTLEALRWISSDGQILDTQSKQSRDDFIKNNSKLIQGIQDIAEEIRSQPELTELIRQKYLLKNTTGYTMNSFLDFHDPIDILSHLLIGSEGTLGFISEITYETVQELPYKSNALVFFKSVGSACQAVKSLKQSPAKAIELMDYQALCSVKQDLPSHFKDQRGCTALLIDVHAKLESEIQEQQQHIKEQLKPFEVELIFTDHHSDYSHLWKIRKGMFPSVAAMRNTGETVIIEDIAVPLDSLAEATIEIQELFTREHYASIIFGHAKEGNLHIVFNQSFQNPSEKDRYKRTMDQLCDLITKKYRGSLKAEHGTGRNMAPFVEQEWGPKIYGLMERIKNLFDPKSILNPDVILTKDPNLHLKNLKPIPAVHEHIDDCMECGFCERVCPSKDLSLTPRQRILALREQQLHPQNYSLIQDHHLQFDYRGNQTCATDGMCAQACPVKIDTGKMVKSIRELQHSSLSQNIASYISNYQAMIEFSSRLGLKVYHTLVGLGLPLLRKLPGSLPKAAKQFPKLTQNVEQEDKVIFFSSCMNRIFESSTLSSLISLANKAKIQVFLLNQPGQCCGLPYSSKGYIKASENKFQKTLEAIYELNLPKSTPIVVDNSPCTQQLSAIQSEGFQVLDSITWLSQTVLDKLQTEKSEEPLAIHLTCSSQKMNLHSELITLAKAISTNPIQPKGIDCCGFAGDRGITHPELNHSALKTLQSQLPEDCHKGASNSKTCEIGLSWHSDCEYQHIAQYLDQQSKST